MKYCTKCTMPDTRQSISFDAEGVCTACRHYEARKEVGWAARFKEFEALCNKYRGMNGPGGYDCAVAVSGGKTAIFKCICKEAMHMNPILFSAEDNFPMTEAGKHNLKNISEAFGCNDSPSSVSSESASNATDSPKPENDVSAVFGSVSYQTHVQDIGWQAPVSNGMTAGTTGRAKRVEALKINLLSQDGTPLGNDSISVQSHISGIGCRSLSRWVTGRHLEQLDQSRAIEAIKLSLSGGLSDSYDIWYRVHSANVGWLGWASNGEPAGTQGYALSDQSYSDKGASKKCSRCASARRCL